MRLTSAFCHLILTWAASMIGENDARDKPPPGSVRSRPDTMFPMVFIPPMLCSRLENAACLTIPPSLLLRADEIIQ
jgi:hypothetical protein